MEEREKFHKNIRYVMTFEIKRNPLSFLTVTIDFFCDGILCFLAKLLTANKKSSGKFSENVFDYLLRI